MKKVLPLLAVGVLVFGGFGAVALSENDSILLSISAEDECDMVIIAPEIFSKQIQPLIDHKNSHGVQTILKTTEEIYDEYTGRDKAEQVKYFIKDALETWNITYVLLIGGKKGQSSDWYVPVRYSNLDDGFDRYVCFISDLYFADIYKNGNEFEDWDSNGNDIFAEWIGFTKDELDLVPDVYLGRLPCRNRFEVKIVVDKIINYENNAYGQSWFNKMVVVGGDTFPEVSGPFPYEGESTCDVAAEYMDGFDVTKLYTSTGTLTSSDDLIDALSEGCGFFLTRGKGGTNRVRVNTIDGTEFIPLHNKYIPKLKNKDMYPICILGECLHGKFDVSILNIFKLLKKEPYYYQDDCSPESIAWRMVRKINGGSIATLSNSNLCFGSYGDSDNNSIPDDAERYGGLLACEVFRLYGEEGKKILGEIHAITISDYVANFPVMSNKIDCKSVQEWILFGDPSLVIGGYA